MEKKSRIIYIVKLLYEKSDEENPISTLEIIDYLESLGMKAHRTTIAADVALLQESGIDVIAIRSSPNKYFIGDRQFELPELKLLVDAVESSKFITSKKSEALVKKISALTSEQQAEELKRQLYIDRRIKPDNEYIYYTVDIIQAAMRENKKIEFRYFEYDPDKKRVFKNKGYMYEFSPYTLFWSEDHYYVIGYSRKHKKIIKFRVDRIANPELSKEDAVPRPADFDPAIYAKQIFEMYDGESKTVELKCGNDLMNVIIDRFGEEVETKALGSTHFKATVDVSISPTFYGWVFGFVGKMSILAPEEVKEEYKVLAREAADGIGVTD